jgi:hypothetical protein
MSDDRDFGYKWYPQNTEKQIAALQAKLAEATYRLNATEERVGLLMKERDEALAKLAEAERVSCKSCGGADTAAAANAQCYNCRNKPHWELEDLRAKLAAAEGEIARAMAVLAPNMPESGLEDACRQIKQMKWQPIETGPRDGTPVLVWLERVFMGSQVQTAHFRPNVSVIGSVFAFDAPKPTHWMPLPEPPAEQQEGEGLIEHEHMGVLICDEYHAHVVGCVDHAVPCKREGCGKPRSRHRARKGER